MNWSGFQIELYAKLAAAAQTAQLRKYSSQQTTKLITHTIKTCAELFQLNFTKEHKIEVNGRIGYIDVALFLPKICVPHITIEIDRGNKVWSVTKLIESTEAGSIACWIKWGNPIDKNLWEFAINNGVTVMDITTKYTSPK